MLAGTSSQALLDELMNYLHAWCCEETALAASPFLSQMKTESKTHQEWLLQAGELQAFPYVSMLFSYHRRYQCYSPTILG